MPTAAELAVADAAPAGTVPPAVDVRALDKRFGPVHAVQSVSFSVARGEIFAFLGPNGAGKSTTLKMLCTLSPPTGGGATVAGFDVLRQPRAVRRRIGMVFQDQTLDEELTAEENLRFHAVLYRVPRAEIGPRLDRVLDLVGLSERRRDPVSAYSGGMARRLEIARALLHTPEVLFLDEPTVGLDPQTRARMWTDVRRLRDEEGVTIFLTTHYMDEAEHADRIAIIDNGTIVALDTPTRLKAAVGSDTVLLATADDDAAEAALTRAGYDVRPGAEGLTVFVEDGEASVGALIAAAVEPVRLVRVHRPNLDDVFMHFTGHEIRNQQADSMAFARRWMTAARRR